MVAEANETLRRIKSQILSEVRSKGMEFFDQIGTSTMQSMGEHDDDDDGWFQDDDEIDDMIKKGDLKIEFIQFLNGKHEEGDRESMVSWGTGNTNYTDLETVEPNPVTSTAASSITDSAETTVQEITSRKNLVREQLVELQVDNATMQAIFSGQSPYELVMSGIGLKTWKIESEIFLINLIRAHQKQTDKNNDGP